MTGEPICGAVKQGRVTLRCTESKGHEPNWHKAEYADHQEVTYYGAHHDIRLVETVTWQPTDLVGEAAKLITAAAADRAEGAS